MFASYSGTRECPRLVLAQSYGSLKRAASQALKTTNPQDRLADFSRAEWNRRTQPTRLDDPYLDGIASEWFEYAHCARDRGAESPLGRRCCSPRRLQFFPWKKNGLRLPSS